MTKPPVINGLYYITHIANLPSILEHGILSHAQVEKRQIPFTPIYDLQIVSGRQAKSAPNGKSLWDFANLYFQPRNPMLYRVISERNKNDIVIIGLRPDILRQVGVFVSTGNAASSPSDILPVPNGLNAIYEMWNVINSEWWKEEDGSKRKIMAECLVPEYISPDFINTIYVASHEVAERARLVFSQPIPIVPEPNMFFQPTRQIHITKGLFLLEGDMLFSKTQTLTISVNTVGVMGKGLASRTKYQFPDVYVFYQDACRQKLIQTGKPHLYKRESSLDDQLASDPLPTPNANKWFLLFPTKRHWKEKSDLKGIIEGLEWLGNHYKSEGITSLAVPALGCGLGGLEWRDVGPIICQQLSKLDIPVRVYLPREQKIDAQFLSSEFLLGKKS